MQETKKRGFRLTWKGTSIIILLIVIGGGYLFLKAKPPLEVNTIASSQDDTLVVIGVGNTGFMGLKLEEVLVNNDEQPSEAKLQITSATEGFILPDDETTAEAEGYRFPNIDEEMIKIGTSFDDSYEASGDAVKGAEIYGINITHDEPIHTVKITYRHFGITYEEIVEL